MHEDVEIPQFLVALKRLERRVLWSGVLAVLVLLGVDWYQDITMRAIRSMVTPRPIAMKRLDKIDRVDSLTLIEARQVKAMVQKMEVERRD